jgi:hypothetical protein
MRALLLLALLGGSYFVHFGCGDDDFNGVADHSMPNDLSAVAPIDQAFTCATGCDPACSGGQLCYGGELPDAGLPDGSFPNISAVCLTTCSTTSDCATGMKCVLDPGTQTQPLCMNDDVPQSCGFFSISTCDVKPACIDAQTLGRQFYSANLTVCGIERVHCPNGCAQIDPDAGEVDGGTPSCAP